MIFKNQSPTCVVIIGRLDDDYNFITANSLPFFDKESALKYIESVKQFMGKPDEILCIDL